MFVKIQKLHGDRISQERHIGDLGNVQVTGGAVSIAMEDKVASMFGPEDMSVSQNVIIYQNIKKHLDDLHNKKLEI